MSPNDVQPSEAEARSIFKALASSGVLKNLDTVNDAEAKSQLLAELSRQGLGNVSPDILICNNVHYCFIVKPV